jgi:Protein of unknown function (DUF2510)
MAETVAASGVLDTGIVLLVVLYLVVIVGSLVMLIVAVVDMAKRPEWQWKLAGQEKVVWILLVVLVNLFAIPALIYWFNIRKKLVAVEQAAAAGQYGPGHMTPGGWEPMPAYPYGFATVPGPGWHPDPSGQSPLRWWDGTRWSDYTWRDPTSPS